MCTAPVLDTRPTGLNAGSLKLAPTFHSSYADDTHEKATGTASLMGGQMEAPVTVVIKRPSSMRMEMSVQGKSLIQAFDGTTAWMINPFMGSSDPQKSNDEDTQAMKDDSDFVGGPLFDYKAKGSTVELIGKEDVEGSPAYKMKVTRKSGNVQCVFVEAQTFLAMRTSGKRRANGAGPGPRNEPREFQTGERYNGAVQHRSKERREIDHAFNHGQG